MTTIVWSFKKGNRKGVFLKAAMTPSREAQEVPALNDWEPVLALDGDRFLIRTFDWKRHRIVDLAAFDEKAFASESGDLPLPEYRSGCHYSPALGHLVLATLPFTVELADLKGNVRRKILLDRYVKGGTAAP